MTLGFSQITSIVTNNNDTVVVITPAQLKTTNLIFNEHSVLKETNALLEVKISEYEAIYQRELVIDSILESSIYKLGQVINSKDLVIKNNDEIIRKNKTKLKYWRCYGVGSIILIVLLCL